jgi:hypothetical protein
MLPENCETSLIRMNNMTDVIKRKGVNVKTRSEQKWASTFLLFMYTSIHPSISTCILTIYYYFFTVVAITGGIWGSVAVKALRY